MTRLLDPARPLALLTHCPAYASTPLHRHGALMVKDESARMGLGAFKALGGVYAVAQMLGVTGDDPLEKPGAGQTFVCASAGNHGLSVAAGARLFGAQARVHLAATVSEVFADRLRAKGATVVWSGATYEDSIAAAIADAEETGAHHLADGAWPGYTEPPRLVMEGYTVIARELMTQVQDWPERVYLQAGVGGLAAALAETIRADWPVQPDIIVVEPEAAPCLRDSVAAGQAVTVTGPVSDLGRLDCKTPSTLAFEILRGADVTFATVTDAEAAAAAKMAARLGHPTTGSGAAGLAVAQRDGVASALCFLTEGPA